MAEPGAFVVTDFPLQKYILLQPVPEKWPVSEIIDSESTWTRMSRRIVKITVGEVDEKEEEEKKCRFVAYI